MQILPHVFEPLVADQLRKLGKIILFLEREVHGSIESILKVPLDVILRERLQQVLDLQDSMQPLLFCFKPLDLLSPQ